MDEQLDKLALEVKTLINKHGMENPMTLAGAVGILEIIKRDIVEEAIARARKYQHEQLNKGDSDTIHMEVVPDGSKTNEEK